ncbi:MAG: translation initiation factor IF-2 [Candidatus Nomurabacteria bacterium]|jgi:translation initiation factor IF-2|nr:translation initiation factor IF-2 [Candidatus Nomurabacteria bacterium]
MAESEKKVLILPEMVTVAELAEKLDITATSLIGELFKNGITATLNQRIDFDTVSIIVDELGLDIELEKREVGIADGGETLAPRGISADAVARPPIVAVMGHVDHGKTTLLDNILGLQVVEGEAGGITQYISAYQTTRNGKVITFLDTPGHETFTALRQHGAVLTDIVIVVVAADDGVKPQTVESIRFAQEAGAKIVVAITKIDKAGANINLVMTQLASEFGLNPEEWGGDTIMVPVNAKTGEGVDKLLDMVVLVADMEELKAENDVPADGLIIESKISHGRGPLGRILVRNGVLRVGEYIVAGSTYGRVRTLQDYRKKPIKEAGPSTPVSVTGFKDVPKFGDRVFEVKNEREARALAAKHYDEISQSTATANITGNDLLKMMNKSTEQETVTVVIKADVQGSLTSVVDSLKLLSTDEVAVKIVSLGIGDITEGDVRQAEISGAVVYGFNVVVSPNAKQIARGQKVPIRTFSVIYELIDDVKAEMSAKLAPEIIDTEIGELKVEGIFHTTRTEVICGGLMTRGKLYKDLSARIFHKKEPLGEATVTSVQREKSEAKEVFEGDMCGLSLATDKKIMLQIGDRLEFFSREVKSRSI